MCIIMLCQHFAVHGGSLRSDFSTISAGSKSITPRTEQGLEGDPLLLFEQFRRDNSEIDRGKLAALSWKCAASCLCLIAA